MKITANGVLLTNNATGAVVAVENGRVYENATRIELTGTPTADGAIEHLKRRKESLIETIIKRYDNGHDAASLQDELNAVSKALVHSKNLLLNAMDVALSCGYDNENMGISEEGFGRDLRTLFGVDTDDTIQGGFLWVIVESDDIRYFLNLTIPDGNYPFGENQRMFIYKA